MFSFRVLVPISCVLLLAACGGGGSNRQPAVSSNANLAALEVDQVVLQPAFDPNNLSYDAEVVNTVSATVVTATVAQAAAQIQVNGVAVGSGATSGPINLVVGSNRIEITVTAQDGTTVRVYSVTVERRVPPSNDASLADLRLSVAPLDQVFVPTLFSYTASTGFLGASTEVTASPQDPLASLELNGVAITADIPSRFAELSVGDSPLQVQVTAEDGVSQLSYDVEVTRADLATLQQRAYVKASNAGPDFFGAGVAIDDNLLVVGAPGEASAATGLDGDQSDDSLRGAGAAYVFERIGGNWSQSAYVKASNTDAGDSFGGDVLLDDQLMIIGASGEQSLSTGVNGDQSDNSGFEVGAAYVFERAVSGNWTQTAYLKAFNAGGDDEFGRYMDYADGNLIVGARFEDSDAVGVNGDGINNALSDAGAAYVFSQDTSGAWRQSAYLKATNPESEDQFGRSVAVSGHTAAVGAWWEDSSATGIDGDATNNGALDAGAAYLFDSDGVGDWVASHYVKASNTDAGDRFGIAMAMDGGILAIGANGEDSASSGVNGDQFDNSQESSGAVYIFERDAGGLWSQTAYLKASNPRSFDLFGMDLALQGNLLAVGAIGQSSSAAGINGDELDQSAICAGAVYLFERSAAGVWSQIAYVKTSNPDSNDDLGWALDIDRDTLVMGVELEDSNSTGINGDQADNSQPSTGAVYILR